MKLNNRHIQITIFVLICMTLYTGWYVQGANKDDYKSGIIRFHVLANSDSKEDQELKLKVRDGVLEAINEKLVRETIEKYDSVPKSHSVEKSVPKNHNPEKIEKTVNTVNTVNTMTEACEEATERVALNIDESRAYLLKNMGAIERIAKQIILDNGYAYDVKAELGVRWIPEKTYGDMTFPAGNYEALNITIGQGEGNNWWCVLFPPLCLIEGTDNPNQAEPFTPTTYAAIGMTEELKALRQKNKGSVSTQAAIKLKFKTLELLEESKKL